MIIIIQTEIKFLEIVVKIFFFQVDSVNEQHLNFCETNLIRFNLDEIQLFES